MTGGAECSVAGVTEQFVAGGTECFVAGAAVCFGAGALSSLWAHPWLLSLHIAIPIFFMFFPIFTDGAM